MKKKQISMFLVLLGLTQELCFFNSAVSMENAEFTENSIESPKVIRESKDRILQILWKAVLDKQLQGFSEKAIKNQYDNALDEIAVSKQVTQDIYPGKSFTVSSESNHSIKRIKSSNDYLKSNEQLSAVFNRFYFCQNFDFYAQKLVHAYNNYLGETNTDRKSELRNEIETLAGKKALIDLENKLKVKSQPFIK